MTTFLRAVATMPASLWVVASCGVLAGAIFAQQTRAAAATPFAPAPAVAPSVDPTAAPPAEPGDAPAVSAPRRGTPLRLLDSQDGAPQATAAPADAPKSGSGPNVIIIVLLVAGVAALYFVKKGNPKAPSRKNGKQLELLSSIRVGGRWQVALVRVPGKTLVLGATEKGLSLLTTLDLDDELDEDPLDVLTRSTGISVSSPPTPPPVARTTPPPRSGRVPTTPHPDAFLGKLLDELNTAPPPVRERPLTPSAEALRQRLERFQRKAG